MHTNVNDFIDRRATAWNRAWVLVSGLWLLAIGWRLPGPAGMFLIIIAGLAIVAASGLVEVALAVWSRHLAPVIPSDRPAPDRRDRPDQADTPPVEVQDDASSRSRART